MLIDFLTKLREHKLPVSIKEVLVLIEAMEKHVVHGNMEHFYLLARSTLIKDEALYDKYDLAFAAYFEGLQAIQMTLEDMVPNDWLKANMDKFLSEEQKNALGERKSLDELIKMLKERMAEQKERHEGGNKWIGTRGTSPFGNSGHHPGGIRIGGESQNKQASKVWDKREFKNLDDSVELGTRNIKMALKKLRQFARTGAADQLDLPDTIKSTAQNAGYLDLKMVPERHNAVKVLLFIDVGGSMYPYVKTCEELFSAAKSEFKHLKHFYFHNFIYDKIWTDNRRRFDETTETWDILHKYSSDYKIIFIGDASMGPWEIAYAGGSVEYFNEEPGAVWMQRMMDTYRKIIWLNPVKEDHWKYTESIKLTSHLVGGKMYPLTLQGLQNGINYLSK